MKKLLLLLLLCAPIAYSQCTQHCYIILWDDCRFGGRTVARWFNNTADVYIYDDMYSPNATQDDWESAIIAAEYEWSTVSFSPFAFEPRGTVKSTDVTMDDTCGVNLIGWKDVTGDRVAAHTNSWILYSSGIKETHTYFNQNNPTDPVWFDWGNNIDIQGIMTHEFGHWLILMDETDQSCAGNVMYGITTPSNSFYMRDLSPDDKAGILGIYNPLPTNVVSDTVIPKELSLSDVYPNPACSITSMKLSLPISQNVIVQVYDILGRQVSEPSNEYQSAGEKTISLKMDNLSSGMYFARVLVADKSYVRKISLVK